jgi:hypothetical protein
MISRISTGRAPATVCSRSSSGVRQSWPARPAQRWLAMEFSRTFHAVPNNSGRSCRRSMHLSGAAPNSVRDTDLHDGFTGPAGHVDDRSGRRRCSPLPRGEAPEAPGSSGCPPWPTGSLPRVVEFRGSVLSRSWRCRHGQLDPGRHRRYSGSLSARAKRCRPFGIMRGTRERGTRS